MTEISPVARCVCRHRYNLHDGPCNGGNARGVCKCSAFEPDLFQPHTDTLEVLRQSIRLWGYAPTIRELAATLGVSSSATMQSRLDVLTDAGLIERIGPRAIRLIERTP